MSNEIFTNLIKNKIEVFIRSFSILSGNIFYDEKQGKLIHPGEYGVYKEGIVKEFLKMFIPESLSIGTGFVINAVGSISTQLDVVIYNPSLTPKIEDANYKRFYPMECVYGLGEVKTIIRSREEMMKAILPLAKAKRMFIEKHKRNESDNIRLPFTFLFCDEIIGCPNQINEWIVTIYDEHNIEKKFWHNEIATIKTGLFKYATMREYEINGKVIPKNGIISQPTIYNGDYNQNGHLKSNENGYHLISFGHDLSFEFREKKEAKYPDIISYTEEYQ